MAQPFLPRLTPDDVPQFTVYFNDLLTTIEEHLTGGASGSQTFSVLDLIGSGRIVTNDITEGAIPQPVSQVETSLRLPAHEKGYVIDGRFVPVEQDVVLREYQATNAARNDEGEWEGGEYGFLSIDDDGNIYTNWYEEIPDPKPASQPCIGKIYTRHDSIVKVETELSDYLQSQSYMRSTIAALRQRVGVLEGLVTGTGEPLSGLTISWDGVSDKSIAAQVLEYNWSFQSQINSLSGERFSFPMLLPNDIMTNAVARMGVGVGERNVHALDRLPMSVVLLHLHGDGTHNSANHVGPGNLIQSRDTRTFTP